MGESEEKMKLVTTTIQTFTKDTFREDGEEPYDEEEDDEEDGKKKEDEGEKDSPKGNPRLNRIELLPQESVVFNNYFTNVARFPQSQMKN